MNLRPAIEPILITHGDEFVVRLRPSLRAGYLIACKYDHAQINAAFNDLNLTVITDLVEIGADDPRHARKTLNAIIADQGFIAIGPHVPALMKFVAASMGFAAPNEEQTPIEKAAADDERHNFKNALESAFEVGTGWLCWTPADTWNATPAEIIAANRGLVDKINVLKALDNNYQPDSYDPRDIPDEQQVKANLAAFKDKMKGL